MHLLLTDRLSCPRCGPEFGLILLAHEVRNRRILSGELGCANCRESYPVENGFGDLRAPPRRPLEDLHEREGLSGQSPHEAPAPEGSREEALRIAALMGITGGPGTLLLEGPAAVHAQAVARIVGGIEVVALYHGLRSHPEEEGVSRMVAHPGFPFFSGTLRAAVLSGPMEDAILGESARVLVPGGRVVVLGAFPGVRGRLESSGVRILLEEAGVLVGEREGCRSRPLVTLRGS
jgi:uncharacterized protein YbaR (Trm112 family)